MAVVILGLLFAWHIVDKRQAVRAAREGYVRQFELTAAQATLDALQLRAAATEEANRMLNSKIFSADEATRQFQAELKEYQNEILGNPSNTVDDDFLRLLLAN